MKEKKMNSPQKLFTFILIAVLLVSTIGFAAGGLQLDTKADTNSGEIGDNTDNTDDNKQNTEDNTDETLTPPADDENKVLYYHPMTGVKTEEDRSTSLPLGFVVDALMPQYGLSSADIAFEFPIENGQSRFLYYTTNRASLWKVGTVKPTRDYISFTSNFIGGVVVSYGNDDIVKYSAWDASKINLDISKISDYYYVENTLYIYTGEELVNNAINNSDTVEETTYKNTPFNFSDTEVVGNLSAKYVSLPYSDANKTEFFYSLDTGKYTLYKSANKTVDMLNGKSVVFKNLFILYANTTTYENSYGTELVPDTTAGGSGLYVSGGYATEMRWSINDLGELEFKTLSGDILSVNRGNSYVGYYKASEANKVKYN